jgi:hypothetical protein
VTDTVSDEQLREYFQIFHRIYAEKLAGAVPPGYLGHVVRYGHHTQKVIAYISTNWGIGYEYDPDQRDGGIEITKSSARVEESMFRVPRGTLESNPPVVAAVGTSRLHFSSCVFGGQLPCRLDSTDASATLDKVRISYGGRDRVFSLAELFGNRSPAFWSPEKAVERAMDEVLQAVLGFHEMDRGAIPLSEYLARYKQRHVLVLGDFGIEGRRRLAAIKAALAAGGYLPLTLDEIQEVREYDLRHKLVAIASVCRFVVVDDSSRAAQMAEMVEVEKLRAIMLVLRHRGMMSTFVVRPLEATSTVIKEIAYDESDLQSQVAEGVAWAEKRVKDLGERFKEAFPWRA